MNIHLVIGRLVLVLIVGLAGAAVASTITARSAVAQTMPCGPEGCGCRECIRIIYNQTDTASYFMGWECGNPPNPHCMSCETDWEPDSTGHAPEGSCADWEHQFSHDCAWTGCDSEEIEFAASVTRVSTLLALGDLTGAAAALADDRRAFFDAATGRVVFERCKVFGPTFVTVASEDAAFLGGELRRRRLARSATAGVP